METPKILKYEPINEESNARDGYSTKTGFQSPTDDHFEERIDFNKYLMPYPRACRIVRASGNSDDGSIQDGDLIVIDRSLNLINGCFVYLSFGESFSIRKYWNNANKIFFLPLTNKSRTIEMNPGIEVEGIVSFIIKNAKKI